MFLPHKCKKETGVFSVVANGVGMSRYYQTIQKIKERSQDQNFDSYDRFFSMAKSGMPPGFLPKKWRSRSFTVP